MASARLAVASALVSASVLTISGVSEADQASLQSQANTLASQILAQSAQLHTLAVDQTNDQNAVAAAQTSVSHSRLQLERDQKVLALAKAHLSRAAVDSFVTGIDIGPVATFLTSSEMTNLIRSDFQSIATTNINDYIRAMVNAQAATRSAQEILNVHLAQAQSALNQLTSSRADLEAQIYKEQLTLSSVNSQIQSLLQSAIAAKARQSVIQGLPVSSGISAVTAGPAAPAGTSSWGGTPAPPTSAAFAALRQCESGGNYGDNTGNGYYGAYQFSLSTWQGLGFSGLPSNAPPAVQDQAAAMLQRSGWGQWPACAAVLGLD